MKHGSIVLPLYQFSGFTFNPEDGELSRIVDGTIQTSRMSPQPASLLALLLEEAPRVVGRDDIKDRVWSDVEVELEQSLHSCIRQIRMALDDSASDPKIIRTVHRRGYQIIPDVVTTMSATTARDRPWTVVRRAHPILTASVVAALSLAMVATVLLLSARTPATSEPARIAIMSFRPPPDATGLRDNSIAEWLVSGLTDESAFAAAVIGPTTTSRFAGEADALSQVADQLQVDYIINARFTNSSGKVAILAEVIRANDGAHVWAEYLDPSDADSVSAAQIMDGLRRQLAK